MKISIVFLIATMIALAAALDPPPPLFGGDFESDPPPPLFSGDVESDPPPPLFGDDGPPAPLFGDGGPPAPLFGDGGPPAPLFGDGGPPAPLFGDGGSFSSFNGKSEDGGPVPNMEQDQFESDTSFMPGNMIMGDMILTKGQELDLFNSSERNAITKSEKRWPNNIVPYEFDTEYPTSEERKQRIAKLLKNFEVQTGGCIKVVPRTNEADYVSISNDRGCYSWVGHGGGKQIVWLSSTGCFRKAVIHEFLHALGFWHEHNRPDRDDYVTIHRDNIRKRFLYAFKEQTNSRLINSYDYMSVMHYSPRAFTSNGQVTITRNDGVSGGWTMGNRLGMTYEDTKKLMTLYECENETPCEDYEQLYDYKEGDCAKFVSYGYCTNKWAEFMKIVCRRSCGLCDA